ncbi:MAG: GldG family protein [Nitrospirae bacterium]|nr:GldG family protein [Candidatus Manganitrophaceae bacterium]
MRLKQTFSILSGVAGVGCGLAGLFHYLIWGAPLWVTTALEGTALLLLTLFLVTHFEMVKDISTRRSTKFGVNSFLMIAIFIAILSIINFILARHPLRYDLSGSGAFSISPQTVSVLKNLKNEVKVIGFFPERSNVKGQAKDLFENYRYETDKIKFEIVDPDKKPTVAKQYGITEYDTIVLESGGQKATLRTVSEQEVTGALIRISRASKKSFYFVEGHGEHSLDDLERNGFSFLKDSLEKEGFAVKKLLLLSEKKVPDDAAVVVIGGPQRPFIEEEKKALDEYLARGGRLFALVDPLVKTDLEPLLAKWGVKLENDLILDPGSSLSAVVPIVNPGSYPPHPVTDRFNLGTFFPLSRSVNFDPATEGTLRFEPLLKSAPGTWLTKRVEGDLNIDPSRDKPGPIIFGGVIRYKDEPAPAAAEAGKPDPKKMRLVVIGDADFATNGVVRSAGNGDLFQNVVSWLAEEGDLVSIRSQEAQNGTLLLSNQQHRFNFYSSVLIVPLVIFSIGLTVWRRRRRL